MKKNIYRGLFFFILSIVILSCTVNNYDKAVLTEDVVKSFIENYEKLFTEVIKTGIRGWIIIDNEVSMSRLFKAMHKKPPKEIQKIFEQNSLHPTRGHVQIAVLQYGLVADTIEKTLAEIANEARTEKQKENDKQTAGWLDEIKTHINSDDYALIKKYSTELYAIFNQLENSLYRRRDGGYEFIRVETKN